jgi:soluble lytic murein transglycosylase-like protein
LCFSVTADAAAPNTPIAASSSTEEEKPAPVKAKKQDRKTATKAGAKCEVSDKYPASIRQWCNLITKYGEQYDLPPDLIAAVMLQESGGDSLAYSHSGAVGLLQVMPRDGIAASFMCANGPCFSSRPTIQELQDPEFNLDYGVRMLAGLNTRRGSLREALKSYGPMDRGYSYADKVLAIYENYR